MTKLQIPSKLNSSQIFRNGNIMCYFLAHKGTFLSGEEKESFWKFSYCAERCLFFYCLHYVLLRPNTISGWNTSQYRKYRFLIWTKSIKRAVTEVPCSVCSSIILIKKIYRSILSIWKQWKRTQWAQCSPSRADARVTLTVCSAELGGRLAAAQRCHIH